MNEITSNQRIKHIGTMVKREVQWQKDVAELSKDISALKERVKDYERKRKAYRSGK